MAFDRRETSILLIGDFCILAVSLWLALLLRNLSFPAFSYFKANFIPFFPVFFISLIIFYIAGLYEKQTRPIRRRMGMRILGAQVATVALASILFFVLPFSIAPKTILVLYLLVSVSGESVWRFYRMHREKTEAGRVPAVLIGTGPAATELFEEIQNNDWYRIRFVARYETQSLSEKTIATVCADVPIVIIDTTDTRAMRIFSSYRAQHPTDRLIVRDFGMVYEEIFDRVSLDHIDSTGVLDALSAEHQVYDGAKRVFDIILALFGAILAIPFILLSATALFLENGNAFFRHERIGKDGQPFLILKLRSMLLNDHGDPELQKKNKVTTLGKFVRKTRIDELPQLWNIIKGELSFIGPRPELPKIAEVYEREIPQYWMRHSITPGLSGWAQIHDYDAPRGGADVPRTRRKLSYDLYYLKHRSFGLDLAIAVKTIRALLSFSGT